MLFDINAQNAHMQTLLLNLSQFDKALLRDYLGDSTWMTWCTNPQGCGEILLKGDGMNISSCQRCQWSACFFCTYLEVCIVHVHSHAHSCMLDIPGHVCTCM